MKKYIIYQIVLLFLTASAIAQNIDCNRAVWINRFTKMLPKEVCIPKGNYHITEVYEKIDLNDDGFEDFIFDWNKNPLQDGDTIYVTIYFQNSDSTFSYFRTFNNLYPIYFKDYSLEYPPKVESLKVIHKKYEGENQFLNLSFEKNLITLKIKNEAKEDLWVQYYYDKSKKDWLYLKAELHDYALDKVTPIDLSDKIGPSINNFTYFYWEE
jgi:hypothetical protein